MKAILVNDDRSLRWDNVPDPIIKSEEVLVKIEAAALNRADLMQREGDYPPPAGCPEWMGLEVAGEIVEVGEEAAEKSDWKVGDKVCALLGGGGYAEYVSVATSSPTCWRVISYFFTPSSNTATWVCSCRYSMYSSRHRSSSCMISALAAPT